MVKVKAIRSPMIETRPQVCENTATRSAQSRNTAPNHYTQPKTKPSALTEGF